MLESRDHQKIGWYITVLGIAMIGTSMVLIWVFNLSGAVLHNILQIGGLVLAVLGYLFMGGRMYQKRDSGDEVD